MDTDWPAIPFIKKPADAFVLAMLIIGNIAGDPPLGGLTIRKDDTCAHQGGPLGEGELEGTVVTCPWHEWRYDVRTGINTDDATCKVASHPVKIVGEDVLVLVQ